MEHDLNDPNIPIVGKPANVILWYPTVIVHCHCNPQSVTLLVMTGFGNPARCGNCNRLYQIVDAPGRVCHDMKVQLQLIIEQPATEGKVM